MTDRPRIPNVDEAREYLARFNFFERYVHGPEEGHLYVATHARRFVETLKRLPPAGTPPQILELGAVPYSMTILLRRYFDANVDTFSFYEVEEGRPRHHVLQSPDGLETYRFEYRPINVERDPFPVADASYDIVLCCELLEHVYINPSHMFFESHRVLKPGGFLVVTTPNVARAANVRALTEGRNIYDAYHGNGVYGRHNREYTSNEVNVLLDSCGFDIVRTETVDVYDSTEGGSAAGREDTIITVAQAIRPRRIGTPQALYVLMNEYVNIVRPAITMGIDEVGHLGRGWYERECDGDLMFRWMSGQAMFYLQTDRARSIGMRVQAHHPDVRTKPVHVSVAAGGRPLGRVAIEDHAWQDLELTMEEFSGPLEVMVSVDREWVPDEVSAPGDRRRLGAVLHALLVALTYEGDERAPEAARLVAELRDSGRTVVFTNGVFDLLHPGHVRYLQQARALGDALVVGINSDASVRRNKGPDRPINPEDERAEILAALDCVDIVVIFDEDTPAEIVQACQPDVLVKGADWPADQIVGRDTVEARGGRVVRIPVEPGHSTTAIIDRIRFR